MLAAISGLSVALPPEPVPSKREAMLFPVMLLSCWAIEPEVIPRLKLNWALNRSMLFSRSDSPIKPNWMACAPLTCDDEVRNFVCYATSLQVNATHVRGAHAIQFGFMGESDLLNNIDRFSAQFNFNRGMTSGSIAQQDSSITGNSIASLLLGTGSGGSATLNPDIAASMPYYALYAQDTWHATRKLNLIYGLRYEIQPGATERFNRWSLFDFNATNPLSQSTGLPLKGGFVYASPGNRGLWQTDTTNFAPRVGLAYQIKPNLVVRAGFGVFYMQPSALITFDSPGQSEGFSTSTAWVSSVGGGGLVPQDLLSNPF